MPDDHYDDFEDEELEAYCVSCKQKTFMVNPMPVWTRKGAAATRATCEICGTTTFRMGKTDAHARMKKPDTSSMFGSTDKSVGSRKGSPKFAAYINYTSEDAEMAGRIAEGLDRLGIPAWFDPDPENASNGEKWASGVQPGLAECTHMVYVLSGAALQDERVEKEWKYFRENRKPIVVAQLEAVDVPDDLRSRPRFDFADDYKIAFRRLSQALFE